MAAAGRNRPVPPRQAPLDGAALRAALLDGLRFHALATGSPVSGNAAELVEHQLSAIRRACRHVDPPNVRTRESPPAGSAVRPPMQLTAPAAEDVPAPELPWWQRD